MELKEEILNEIKELYNKGMSIRGVRNYLIKNYNLKLGKETIRNKLSKLIKLRKSGEYLAIKRGDYLDKDKIIKEYIEHKLSLKDVAKLFNASASGIKWILIKNNIILRTKREGLLLKKGKYIKLNFNGNDKEKAYLIGITLGDAHVRSTSKYSIEVNTTSTHKALIDVFVNTYKDYTTGVLTTIDKTKGYRFVAYVNNSFNFLLKIKRDTRILNRLNINNFLYFIAGFFDAEGSIVKRKHRKSIRCVLKIGNTDLNLLNIIKKKLEFLKFNPKIYLYSKKGKYHDYHNNCIINRKNYYMLEINRKDEVLRLLKILDLKHKEKISRKKWAIDFLTNPSYKLQE